MVDLSLPLTTVSPTLDAGVLQVLAATTAGCTAANVHQRLAKGSNEGVRKVLARLVQQGVVIADRTTRYPVYHLNREHVAVPHIEALSRVRDEILARIRTEVSTWTIQPAHSSLFGSFARGDATSVSDIDLLIVEPESPAPLGDAWLTQLDRLGERIRAWTGNAAQIVALDTTTLGEMARDADPLVASWLSESVHLQGEQLSGLLRRLR